MTNKLMLFSIILLLCCLLNSCSSANNVDIKANESTQIDPTPISSTNKENFINGFSEQYPDYELLDFVEGIEKNRPIIYVALAKDKRNGTASTLFVVDENGIGKVTLADGFRASYLKESGLFLRNNVILFSLDLTMSDGSHEIHDFEIIVTQTEDQGVFNTIYTSNEVVRSKEIE